jgi:AI-2 transport protein TqsA
LFALLVAYAGQQMIVTAEDYAENLDNLVSSIQMKLDAWDLNLDISTLWSEQTDQLLNELKTQLPGIVTRTFGRTVSLFGSVMLLSIFLIFLLAGRNPHVIRQGIYAEMDQKVRGYIATKVLLSAATGMLVWISLSVIGLDLALAFGLLAFLLNFIPSIGSIIATLLPIPLAVAQFGGEPWRMIAVIAIPGAIQMGIGNGLEPKLMGKELELHPITVLLTLSFWGLLWGLIGMLLAVPITAVIRIVLLRFETTRAIGDLLAGKLPTNENLEGKPT